MDRQFIDRNDPHPHVRGGGGQPPETLRVTVWDRKVEYLGNHLEQGTIANYKEYPHPVN